MLDQSWQSYQAKFIQADGRVVDWSADQITTSEGQSYAMLRSAWVGDRAGFEKAWSWTQTNLKRDDKLFAWKWGKKQDGTWGIIDTNAATDADQDIAFALLIAGDKWSEPKLREQALDIIRDIWRQEVVHIQGKPYLTAGNWAPGESSPTLNPSYFAPYIYRSFAKVDKEHDWSGVVDSSYEVLAKSSSMHMLHLPPDWCLISKEDGSIILDKTDKRSDYSYDAMRAPWRIAMDYKWYADERAKRLLEQFIFLRESWRITRSIKAAYTAYGVTRSLDEPLAGFGCVLPMFGILEPDSAQQIVQERITSVYNEGLFRPENDYYNNNWAWFGLAGYSGLAKPPSL